MTSVFVVPTFRAPSAWHHLGEFLSRTRSIRRFGISMYFLFCTVFRRLATSTDHLNSMLRSYDISLMLRLGRDSRHWRMVAKGPEKHVDLLIDVYRAIRDSSHDPIASIRNALLVTPMK